MTGINYRFFKNSAIFFPFIIDKRTSVPGRKFERTKLRMDGSSNSANFCRLNGRKFETLKQIFDLIINSDIL